MNDLPSSGVTGPVAGGVGRITVLGSLLSTREKYFVRSVRGIGFMSVLNVTLIFVSGVSWTTLTTCGAAVRTWRLARSEIGP